MTIYTLFVIYCQVKKAEFPIYNGFRDVISCVHPFPGGSPKELEGIKETPMKGLLPLGVSELQIE